MERPGVGGDTPSDHRDTDLGYELEQVERFRASGHVLGGDDGTLDDEDVQAGVEGMAVPTLYVLRSQAGCSEHTASLDLLDSTSNEIGFDRLLIDLLDDRGRLIGRGGANLFVHGHWILVPGPETFEVEDA
jgi:hypothetical protein